MTKISIITVVYNGEKTIEDTISSILFQKDIDLEYIVIDGNSTDNTISIIKKYKECITTFISEPDQGIYDAMNKGISLATGEIIGFLNADDVYNSPDVLARVMSIFDSNAIIDIVYGDLVYVQQENISKIVRYWKGKNYYYHFFDDGFVPPHPSFFVRRRVYEQAGKFNTEYKFAADYEIMFRFLKIHQYNSSYLPDVLVRMRLGGATNHSIKNVISGNREIWKIWKTYKLSTTPFFWMKRSTQKFCQFLKRAPN